MDSKKPDNVNQILSLIPGSLLLYCAFLPMTLTWLSGCSSTDAYNEDDCSLISCRVKKCFLFHTDKCSPKPYYALEGYQKHLDRFMVKHAAKKCAHVSLKNLSCNCKEKPTKPFRKGYRQAYIDVALGDSGEVPPVPPKEYWAANYRTPEGYMEVQEWFTGYKLGAEHALADGRIEYNKIATPYFLAGWDHSVSDHGASNNYPTETEAGSDYAPPVPKDHQNQLPELPSATEPHQKIPAPAPPVTRPSETIPQRKTPLLPPPPQSRQPLKRSNSTQNQIHKRQPDVAPKPVLQAPAQPAVKSQRPIIRHHSGPTYRNDDPPPNPYSLQSYPYTPVPVIRLPANQDRQSDHLNTRDRPRETFRR